MYPASLSFAIIRWIDWRLIPNSSAILLCVTQVIPALLANDDIIASTVRFLSVIRLSVNARNGMMAN